MARNSFLTDINLDVSSFLDTSHNFTLVKVSNGFLLVNLSTNQQLGPITQLELSKILQTLPITVDNWPSILSEQLLTANSETIQIIEIEAGFIETIEGTVTATHTNGEIRKLISGDAVYQGEILITGEDASINISFLDGSDLSLGSESEIVIDEFIYDPDASSGTLGLDIVEGVFVFVSGEIAENDPEGIVLNTPTASLGIRGTTVAGRISSENSGTTISLLEDEDGAVGQVVVTNDAGTVVLEQPNATTHVLSSAAIPREPIVLPNKAIGILYQSSLRSSGSNERTIESTADTGGAESQEDTPADISVENDPEQEKSDAPPSQNQEPDGVLDPENIEELEANVERINEDAEFVGSATFDDDLNIDDANIQVFAVDESTRLERPNGEAITQEDFEQLQEDAKWEERDKLYDAIDGEASLIVAALADKSAAPEAIFQLVESSAERLSVETGFSVEKFELGSFDKNIYIAEEGFIPESWDDEGSNPDKSENSDREREKSSEEDDFEQGDKGPDREPSIAEVASHIKNALIAESLTGVDKLNFGGPLTVDIERELEFLFRLISGEEDFDDGITAAEDEARAREDDNFVVSGDEFDVDLIISGTNGADIINGTDAGDGIDAGAGNDTVSSGRGDDAVLGGLGDDTLTLGTGNDRAAGDGDFSFPAGSASSSLSAAIISITESAGDGDDTIDGGDGNDDILGLGGDDLLIGGEGDDVISGGSGDDQINLGNGTNEGDGGDGDDTITGGSGVDEIIGRGGNDTLTGNGGDDIITAGTGNDILDGGDGSDELDGSDGNDTITGGSGDDTLFAGSGTNSLNGGDGDDIIFTENDTSSRNTIEGGSGNDTINPSGGVDIIDAGIGDDFVDGSNGNDTITGGNGLDQLSGGDGDDTITGGSGEDTIDGGNGADNINGGDDADLITAGEGADIIDGGGANDIIQGQAGADTITVGSGDDTLFYKFNDNALNVNSNVTTAANSSDKILDFGTGDNNFTFSNSDFLGGELSTGTLSSSLFFSISQQYDGTNSGASSSQGIFIFDSVKNLYFDEDPANSAGYTLIATVENSATITNSDIIIVS